MNLNEGDPRRLARKLPPKVSLLDRVLLRSRLDSQSGCWIFAGAIDSGGYGMVRRLGVNYRAHAVTYRHLHGDPAPLVIDHLCRRRACCNPDHLEAVPNGVNSRDRARHSSNGLPILTHCQRGHERTPENTYPRPDGKGTNCLVCIRFRSSRAHLV